jgi:hypothetical protein
MQVELTYGHVVRLSLTDKAALVVGAALAGSSMTFTGISTGAVVTADVDEDGILAWESAVCDTYESEDGLTVEVVANHYCSLDAILDYDAAKGTSPRVNGVTPEQAFVARDRATSIIEEALGYCMVRRVEREELFCDAGRYAPLKWGEVVKVVSGDATLASRSGVIPMRFGLVPVTYQHGSRVVTEDVSAAVARLAAYYLTPSNTPERATGQSTDAGFLRFTIAGVDGETGIPEVDAVIKRRRRTRMVVA